MKSILFYSILAMGILTNSILPNHGIFGAISGLMSAAPGWIVLLKGVETYLAEK